MSLAAYLSLFPQTNVSHVGDARQRTVLQKPPAGQSAEVAPALADTLQILALARQTGGQLVTLGNGALAVQFPDGAMLILGWTGLHVDATAGETRTPRMWLA